MGAFEPCACSTSCIICASIVSCPTFVARNRKAPVCALQIPSVEHQTKTYSVPGFAEFHFSPATGANWTYEFDASQGKSDFGFAAKTDSSADVTYPFDGAPVRLEGKAIDLLNGKRETITLIPMGSILNMLRRVTFPVVIARDWQGSPVVATFKSQRE